MLQEFFKVQKTVFRTGTWKGDLYTEKDLDSMVSAFNELKTTRDFPLKLGHKEGGKKLLANDHRAAVGWLTGLKKVGKDLVATFSQIPKIFKQAIEKGMFKTVSSEVWHNFKSKAGDKVYPKVLTGVALLGATMPELPGLGAFGKFYEIDDDSTSQDDIRLYAFEDEGNEPFSIEEEIPKNIQKKSLKEIKSLLEKSLNKRTELYNKQEEQRRKDRSGINADIDVVSAQIEILRKALGIKAVSSLSKEADEKKVQEEKQKMDDKARIAELEKENGMLKEKNVKLEKDNAAALETNKTEKAAKEKAEQKIADLAKETRTAGIKAFIEKAKGEGKIVPATEKSDFALLEAASDEKTVDFSIKIDGKETSVKKSPMEILQDSIMARPKLSDMKEYSQTGAKKEEPKMEEGEGTENSKKLDAFTKEYQKNHKDAQGNPVSYTIALGEVSIEHPELVEAEKL